MNQARPSVSAGRTGPVSGATVPLVLLTVAVIAALYFGREVLVPIALAILLSFVLAPFVRVLQSWYIPRAAAVLSVTLFALVIAVGLAGLMVAQVNQLASELPRYESTLRKKIQNLRGIFAGTGTLERASEVLKGLQKEIERSEKLSPSYSPGAEPPSPSRPIAVEVKQPDPGALQTLVALITPLIFPLTTTGVVFIFVVFILFQRQDLRNRLIRLAGGGDIQRTTAALDDAGTRLGRLFLMQLALNAAFGLVIGFGLWLIGVPSAPLWGMMAMILRFVPYVGALIAAIFPLLLAAAVDPGWSMVLWTAALFIVVEPLVGHGIEPLLFGHSAGLSPVAVVVSATFWTWLWGPIGLILATPLTICLVVLGRHVDRLKFLDVMFGDEPALTPSELIYQRMLAGDPVEAAEQAWQFLKDKPLLAYYDEILLEGLKLAQADAEQKGLDDESLQNIRFVVAELVDDLRSHEDEPAAEQQEKQNDASPLAEIERKVMQENNRTLLQEPATTQALCIPGVGLLDEAAAIVLAHLIGRHGIGARAEKAGSLSIDRFFSLDTSANDVICLCYLENASAAQIRYALRRVHRAAKEAKIVVLLLRNGDRGEHEFPGAKLARGSFAAAIETVVATSREKVVPV
jgi:predicted PurR-regulated permease PerM